MAGYSENGRTTAYIVALIVATVLGLGVLAAIIVLPLEQDKSNRDQADYGTVQYALVFDAGSSGSRLYVYKWDRLASVDGSGIVSEVADGRCRNRSLGGIASYTVATDAAQSLVQCLQHALVTVPSKYHHATPVFLAATSGMRSLRETNLSHATAILKAIADLFKTYPFLYRDGYAQVLSGADEGLLGWITTNFLLGPVDPNRRQFGERTSGSLDLGGGSNHITFSPTATPPTDRMQFYSAVRLYGKSHLTYTNSYLCWGLDEGRRRYMGMLIRSKINSTEIDDPCRSIGNNMTVNTAEVFTAPCNRGDDAPKMDRDYKLYGISNNTRCHELVTELFPKAPCNYSSCSFNGAYQPSLPSSPFLAFSGYYYQARSAPIDLLGPTRLSDMLSASDTVCNMTFEQIKNLPDLSSPFTSRYCFQLKYAIILLLEGLNFTEASTVDFRADVNGTSTGWTLGFIINATNTIPVDHGPSLFMSKPAFVAVVTVLGILLLMLVLFIVVLGRVAGLWCASSGSA